MYLLTLFDIDAGHRIAHATAIILGTFLLYLIYLVYHAYLGPLSRFPGPKLRALSVLPTLRTLVRGTTHIDIPALHDKYGPIVRTGPNELSFNGGAEAWHDIYGARKRNQAKPVKDPFFFEKSLNGAWSLISADDTNHSRQRRILSYAFSDRALKEQEPMLKAWAAKFLKKLGQNASDQGKADMLKLYNCTSFDIMGELTFSENLKMLDDGEYSPWVKTIFSSVKVATFWRAVRMYSSFTNWFVKKVLFNTQTVRKKQWQHWRYAADRVDRRLQMNPEKPDLWTRILAKCDGPDALTKAEHEATASLFMIAGTETTATALSGLTYYLVTTPRAAALLNKEIRSSITSFDELTIEQLARLPYLQACIMEGLRLYPPVPGNFPRKTPRDGSIIAGQYVPAGVTVACHHVATYRSATHFKNPHLFHPERWIGDPDYAGDDLNALEPFHVGPRNCLGKNLAWHEMRILMATVLLHYDLTLAKESESWIDQHIYTLWEKKPLVCNLQKI